MTDFSKSIDFAEISGVDFSTRLISSGGTLNVQTATSTVPALNVNGYTRLAGNSVPAGTVPAVAMIKITGTMPGTNAFVDIPTNIAQAKVLAVTMFANQFPPSFSQTASGYLSYEYSYLVFDNIVRIFIGNNGAIVANIPFRMMITYEQ